MTFKGNVIRDIKNQEKRNKERQREEFAIIYERTRSGAFLDESELNLSKFVAIHKDIISCGLSKSALAVYLVLCSKADFQADKTFQISQENIAFWAGVSENTVRKATEELEEAELLVREKITEGPRHFYIYRVGFIRKSNLEEGEYKGNTVYFYTCIIDNGIWAKLKPRAKVLYLAMRSVADQDFEEYSYIESTESGEFYERTEYDEYIRNRKWDVCNLSLAEMCRVVGVERSNLNEVLSELEGYKLIERVGEWTKVYLKPRRFLKHK